MIIDEVDYLIVGAGLSGIHLARQLKKQNKRILVWQSPDTPIASRVAAGVLNPVTGQRLVKTWFVETLLPYAKVFYREMESFLNETFFHETEIIRYCKTKEEVERWHKRREDPAYQLFLKSFDEPNPNSPIKDNFGSFHIANVGHLDLITMIKAWHKYLRQHKELIEEKFDYSELEFKNGFVLYRKKLQAKAVIFCEGFFVKDNPFFGALPFKPSKGESIDFYSEDLYLESKIYHKEKWLLSLGKNKFRLGSTFHWEELDFIPTENGKRELLKGLRAMLPSPIKTEIIEHRAGVRPNTKDTKPYLGKHPDHPALYVFNGMGSKAALLTPWLSEHMANFIIDEKPLLREVNINRIKNNSI